VRSERIALQLVDCLVDLPTAFSSLSTIRSWSKSAVHALARLLRVLQESSLRRVGGKTERRGDTGNAAD
jgi:hypothetical protein